MVFANAELSFVHADSESDEHQEHWPFVYLHGEAEYVAETQQGDWDHAPDICLCNQPAPDIPPGGKLVLACNVHGFAAVCVLWRRKDLDLGFVQGRVALIKDPGGLAHALDCEAWR